MPVYSYEGAVPEIAEDVFIAPGAHVIGNVKIGAGSSVWYNCVLRGDVGTITIGEFTNIQDGTVVHVTGGAYDTVIGSHCLIGHTAATRRRFGSPLQHRPPCRSGRGQTQPQRVLSTRDSHHH